MAGMDTPPITLAALGVKQDPGTDWHPRPTKTEARDRAGNLRNLSPREVEEHWTKPEAAHQPDGRLAFNPAATAEPMAAEDSEHTPDGEL